LVKAFKSQWEFGELFPRETAKAITVSELTTQIKRALEKQVGKVRVTGEVTNLRAQSSGHLYFTLKDPQAQLSCVLFRGEAQVERALVQDGRKVILEGEVTVYEPRGQYQLRVTLIELEGEGALQAAFEKLKARLKAEGLFETARKRVLPRFPARIGLVTSASGAAIRDVLHVVGRRNPSLEIILVACRVQGAAAAQEIAAAVRLLNRWSQQPPNPPLDLILLTRGGGSLEDLWAFNEEPVARAIFESVVPVVSAVGHEVDFTISDFVADVRAATPSAAAEIITEGVYSSCAFVDEAVERIALLTARQLARKAERLEVLNDRLLRVHPRRRLDELFQRLDDLSSGMTRCANVALRQEKVTFTNLFERLGRVRPSVLLRQKREVFEQENQRFQEALKYRFDMLKQRLAAASTQLRLLGPEQVLARGYSITSDAKTGAVLRDTRQIKAGQEIKTRLRNGEMHSRVERV
jgi:exodeoxyribonuclease VII large subunit